MTACTSLSKQHPFVWNSDIATVNRSTSTGFTLYTAQKLTAPNQNVTIYIEGDGHSWVSRTQLSTDPTPHDTLVRGWVNSDPAPNVAYIARPCQFVGQFTAPCKTEPYGEYWDAKRFAPEIIEAVNQTVSQIQTAAHAPKINLVGFSGGGAVAALVAASRDDVASLTTYAGNLDTALHAHIHGVSPLDGSLNPRDYASHLGSIKQIHYSGSADKNVTTEITRSFVNALPQGTDASIVVVPNATHNTGWK